MPEPRPGRPALAPSAADSGGPSRRTDLTWSLALALRYLRSGRKDAYVSFLSAVALGGISLGVAALVLALGALNGLQQALRQEVLRRTSEIEIHAASGVEVERLEAEVRDLVGGGGRVARRVRGSGWILVAGGGRSVEIQGFEGDLPSSFPEAESRRPGLYLSDRSARHYGLAPDDVVEIASARSTLSPLGPVPRVRRLALAGTFDHSVLREREVIAVPLDVGIDLLGGAAQHLSVATGSLEGSLELADGLRTALGERARVLTWQDLNGPLLLALRLEKRLMFLAVFLVVLVGSLALVSDLSLIVANRRREIGILGAMGAPARRLRDVFLLLGLTLAGLGVTVGGVVGTAGARLLDRFELIRLPGETYLLDHVPFVTEPLDILVVVAATLVTAFLCSWVGAGKATALTPVEALRR